LSSRFLTFRVYLAISAHPGRSLTLAAPRSLRVPSLTTPPVLTPLILGPAPKLPGCKRLHLSFSPSQRDRRSRQAKSRILSVVRCRGCVRRPHQPVTSSPSPPALTPLTLSPAPNLPGCKRLHLSFGPSWVVGSSGRAKSRIRSGWLRTPGELQPSQGAQTAPHSRGLGGWPGWAREFVARQPVAAFRSPSIPPCRGFINCGRWRRRRREWSTTCWPTT